MMLEKNEIREQALRLQQRRRLHGVFLKLQPKLILIEIKIWISDQNIRKCENFITIAS